MKRVYVLIVLVILMFGCATQMPLRPVTDATKRLEFLGFSILPPQGKNWYVGAKGKYGVTFWKIDSDKYQRSADATHTFLVTVMIVHSEGTKIDTPQDFRQGVDRYFRGLTAGRFRVVESKVIPYSGQGTDCVQYDLVQEERDHPKVPGAVLTITAHGFLCRHPFSQERIVHGFYSERYRQGEKSFLDETLKQEAEEFLKTVVFTPLR